MGSVTAGAGKLVFGIISDLTLKVMPRCSYIFIMTFAQLLVFSVNIGYGDNIYMVLISAFINYGANACCFTLVPVIISERFGATFFSINWGLSMLTFGFISWGFMCLFGVLYDSEVGSGCEHCYGIHCFHTTYIISTVAAFAALIMISWYKIRQKSIKRD